MKKSFLSLGLVVAGTSGLQAAYAPDQGSADATRMWSISSSLRGFYDNNYTTGNHKSSSGGFELSPQLNINVPLQQTEFGLRYIYGLYYYQARENGGQDPIDQSHQVDLWLDHAFTERWEARVEDSFIYSQQPALANGNGGAATLPFRTEGNNILNTGTASLHTDWTRLFSTVLGYQNGYSWYQQSGTTVSEIVNNTKGPSNAGTLNSLGNTVWLDLQWQVAKETMLLVGGSFNNLDYTGDEPIGEGPGGNVVFSNYRNSRSYTGYVGGNQQFLPNLSLSAKAGVQYTDTYNDSQDPTTVAPWGMVSLTYTYLPGDYVQLGFNQTQNPTDIVAPTANGGLTKDQESSVVYGSINHKLTAKLTATAIAQAQFSRFNGGAYNNQWDDLYSVGVNLSYAFNRHFSAEVGNNYDDLSSQIPGRSYTRDIVYAGVTATY